MGGSESVSQSVSQQEIDDLTHRFFTSLPEQYISVGIDDSLLQYSGTNSTAVLNAYSDGLLSELQDQIPSYIEKVGTALAGFSAVPHAVGVGALIISMILQIAFITTKGSHNEESVADMLRRIFADEKASEVRDLMEEYMKRYKMHLRADSLLLEDTRHLERSLSHQLTRLRNSMLVDGHMNSRALKHWANGAAFHVQMLIHIARLQKKKTLLFQIAKSAARSAIDTYSRDTSELLKKYKEYKTSNFRLYQGMKCFGHYGGGACVKTYCHFNDVDQNHEHDLKYENDFCEPSPQQYTDYIFSNHPQIIQLKNYFLDLDNNIADLCNQDGTFQIRT